MASIGLMTTAQRWVENLLDHLASRRALAAAAIVVVALCAFLPGLATIPPVDRDEPRFAETARRMATGGPLADGRFDTRSAIDMPIGTVWIAALAAATVGGDPPPLWAYRLPSLLFAVAAALLTWWTALAFGRPRAALLAGLFVAANLILAGEARVPRADAAILAAILVAEGALARLWLGTPEAMRRQRPLAVLFWGAIGLGTLLGGPAPALAVGMTVAVLLATGPDRSFARRLGALWGLPLAILLAAPLALPLAAGHGGPGLGGIFSPGDGLTRPLPPGTYGLLFFALAWPAASFFVLGVPWMLERLRQPAIHFAAAWGIPWWLMAELISPKLAPYILPAIPAVALLAATAVDRGQISVTGRLRLFFSLGPLLLALLLAVGGPLVLVFAGDAFPVAAMPALLVGAAMAAVAWMWLRDGAVVAAAGLAVAASIPLFAGAFGFLLPAFSRLDTARSVMAIVEARTTCASPRFAVAGFPEPALTFLAEGRTRLTDGAGAAIFLANTPVCRLAVVENRQLSSFRQKAEDLGIDVETVGRVPGIALGLGRRVTLQVFRLEPAP